MPGYDPFGSMQAFMGQFGGFAGNPMQYMMQRKLNLPKGMNPIQDPNGAIQYLMNSGKMNQQQYNELQKVSRQVQQNPQFQQMLQQNPQFQQMMSRRR